MASKWKLRSVAVAGVVALVIAWRLTAGAPAPEAVRDKAQKAIKDGNFKDAYEALRKLALDPKDDPKKVGSDLQSALQCLQNLGRMSEIDAFRDAVIAVHKDNWRLLDAAAQTFLTTDHNGYLIAGKFERGYHRGGGRVANALQRDRTRALQLLDKARTLVKNDDDKAAVAEFYLHLADSFMSGRGYQDAWRLQYLTNLADLPDYDEGYGYYGGGSGQGAPVDAKGEPVYHELPKGYADAKTDGERWRWALLMAAETLPADYRNRVDLIRADFLRSQFGVQTMGWYGRNFRSDGDRKNESGTYALHTLLDDETIARLATGVKRFKLPDEHNYLKIYQQVAARGKSDRGARALESVAGEYEDRRQYVKAALTWRQVIADYGPGTNAVRRHRLEQIVGNWGRFEQAGTQPAGTAATIDYRFRNGNKVRVEAHAIDVAKLLGDVKAYIQSGPNKLEWDRTNIGDLGHRLVTQNQKQYLGAKVAEWSLDLKPRPAHVDDRVTVSTPLAKPGAYLITAKMADGNESNVVLWVADTVLAKKPMEASNLFFVADAVTGQPIAKASVEFFGWKQEWIQPNANNFRMITRGHTGVTDDDGQLVLGEQNVPANFSWMIVARKDNRLAYLGFSGVWYGQRHDSEYNATRALVITDRPVYRPQNTVEFKAWVRHAKYDQADTSSFAGQKFTVRITNPKNEKVYEKAHQADDFGGISGEYVLPQSATLGVYRVSFVGLPAQVGGNSFRVEEYKKPEFEVTVDAPKEPVRLGEVITATINAKYYFGAPVINAKVKYKVMRSAHTERWYPRGDWDWMYGRGYWWFAPDYAWYPGYGEWGCMRPAPFWYRGQQAPPEVVSENEVPVGPDGTVPVVIDTKPAKEMHGNQDHQYTITAEVTDLSRRTIVGTGTVLVTRHPFQVTAWVDRGHYRVGDTVKAHFRAQTLDQKPVAGKGELTLFKISYDDKNQPVEKAVQKWKLDTDVEGKALQPLDASKAGQYRLSYKLTDAKDHTIEGGYLFVVRGEGFDGKDYRFNDIEIVADKREYKPGEKVKLMVNANRDSGTVLLFIRPANGIYLMPKVVRMKGKSLQEEIDVVQKDMPNFFVEAMTVSNGRIHTEARELVVPPEKRVLNVAVKPSQKEYKPGEKANIKLKLTDIAGKPFVGTTVVSVYDKSVEYISGGSNVPEIKEFFWKWRRHHYPSTESSLTRGSYNLVKPGQRGMGDLGMFGASIVEEMEVGHKANAFLDVFGRPQQLAERQFAGGPAGPMAGYAGDAASRASMPGDGKGGEQYRREADKQQAGQAGSGGPELVQPTVRKNFADTAKWVAALTTNDRGEAEVSFKMPDQLTGWKVRVWAMGHGTKVGQGEAEVVTKKDLIVRLQAPRFFVEKDEVVLSANVHNYLKKEKKAKVSLEIEGPLTVVGTRDREISIASGGEQRLDWRVKVIGEGQAVVRMKALTDEDSDAMEMRFPCFVHGMLKMESFTGVIRPNKDAGTVTFNVPAERRVNETRLEVRYSPTLAGALVDALPYLVDYPYGCTEQTLNRFLPTVVTQNTLKRMKVDLKAIQKRRTNLNAQEIGDDQERAKGWKRYDRNPVFDEDEVAQMVAAGVARLHGMQLSDGGWGWFSGSGEQSYPHTTATVVHGLQVAKENGVQLPNTMLERGVEWMKSYQAQQLVLLRNAANNANKTLPYREHADNTDAFVYMVLVDAGADNGDMRDFLYRDRTKISVYAKAMFGLALHKQQQADKLAMILQNVSQYLVEDNENQTAYLRLPEGNHWWAWYGSETEANAYYLKLLARTSPKGEKASRLVKYLLNNRKHSTYWNSTRDTALCIEAMAEFLQASGEDRPDMTVEVWLDGKKHKSVKIDSSNLFDFDNKLVLTGDAIETGKHTLEIRRQGTGPVYFNAYLSNFTLEDFITKAGLEVKVERKYYKLTRDDKEVKVEGAKGQAFGQKVERTKRTELKNLAELKSGDLVEVELEIESKNDYEYLLFEDMKPAGFEPLDVRSGYVRTGLGAYMELRDEKVCFFVRAVARGKHSISYRMRAETPGRFSALPTRAYAMYAPELRGNSDEIKLRVAD